MSVLWRKIETINFHSAKLTFMHAMHAGGIHYAVIARTYLAESPAIARATSTKVVLSSPAGDRDAGTAILTATQVWLCSGLKIRYDIITHDLSSCLVTADFATFLLTTAISCHSLSLLVRLTNFSSCLWRT